MPVQWKQCKSMYAQYEPFKVYFVHVLYLVYNCVSLTNFILQTSSIIRKGTLPHEVHVKGLSVGVYSGLIRATDVFGSTAQSAIQYQGEKHKKTVTSL